MTDNLALWRSVEKTDPDHTKAITGKPYKGNSPKPYWIVQKATETFGPCGIGWGIEIVSERVEEGAPGDKVHIAHIRVWYMWDSKRGVVEHVGQTMFCGKNRNGPYTDEDAPKKSVTDALIKALSMVGFAGDIFLGRYDDSKYVSEVRQEFQQERAAPARQEAPRQQPQLVSVNPADEEERRAYLALARSAIDNAEYADELTQWWHGQQGKRREYGIVKGTPEYDELLGRVANTRDRLPANVTAAG